MGNICINKFKYKILLEIINGIVIYLEVLLFEIFFCI